MFVDNQPSFDSATSGFYTIKGPHVRDYLDMPHEMRLCDIPVIGFSQVIQETLVSTRAKEQFLSGLGFTLFTANFVHIVRTRVGVAWTMRVYVGYKPRPEEVDNTWVVPLLLPAKE